MERYYPSNTTLYVVGELDRDVQETEKLIASVFDDVIPGEVPGKKVIDEKIIQSIGDFKPLRERQEVRPPVEHVNGSGPMKPVSEIDEFSTAGLALSLVIDRRSLTCVE